MKKEDAEEFTQSLGQIVGGSYRLILQANDLQVPKALGITLDQWVERIGGYVKLEGEKRRKVVEKLSAEGRKNVEIAKALGVDEKTVRNDKQAVSENSEGGKKKNKKNKDGIDGSSEKSDIDKTSTEKATETRLDNQSAYKWIFDQPGKQLTGDPIRHGDFYELASEIEDGVVDLIFTDPPYDDDSIPLFSKMGEIAKRILKPGGSLITYVGHLQMLDAGRALSEHLRYWHPLVCLHSGAKARMTEYGVIETYKPMLWFVKSTRADKHTFIESAVDKCIEDSVTGAREKQHHAWQQAEAEAAYFIERLTPANGFVVDFFGGGGTTLVAAKRLGRFHIGYEINVKSHQRANDRVAEAA